MTAYTNGSRKRLLNSSPMTECPAAKAKLFLRLVMLSSEGAKVGERDCIANCASSSNSGVLADRKKRTAREGEIRAKGSESGRAVAEYPRRPRIFHELCKRQLIRSAAQRNEVEDSRGNARGAAPSTPTSVLSAVHRLLQLKER